MTSFIRNYFLRMYASRIGRRDDTGWGTYGEAVFQTSLLLTIAASGIFGAGFVIVAKTSERAWAWLQEMEPMVKTVGVAGLMLLAYLVARKVCLPYRNRAPDVSNYSSRRDRVIMNVQFWCVLAVSLGLPLLLAALL